MNYILKKQTKRMPFHATLGPLIESFGGEHEKYNWLITDYEAFFGPFWDGTRTNHSPLLFTGQGLTELANEFPNGQMIWGVLTGLPKDLKIDVSKLDFEPVAEGGTTFWEDDPKLQYSGAAVEVIAWDSGYTILLSSDAKLSSSFHSYFPEAEILEEFNRVHNRI